MNLIKEKFKEVIASVLPMVVLITILYFIFVDFNQTVFVLFIIGSFLLIVGLAIFLVGIDLAMGIIGEYFALETAKSKTTLGFLIMAFLIGFIVTVAEPDLHILSIQLELSSGGVIGAIRFVLAVSFGVGILIAAASLVRVRGASNVRFMAITYVILLALSLISQKEFVGFAYDASGATTGALTTPFALALAVGFGRIRSADRLDGLNEDFGMVGAMSAGPVLIVLLMSIVLGEQTFAPSAVTVEATMGVWEKLSSTFKTEYVRAFYTLLPLVSLFIIWNLFGRTLKKKSMIKVFSGVAFSYVGLMLFLSGIYSGFMEMGTILGMEIARRGSGLLLLTGFAIGLIVVLVEPAVIVLCHQIEDNTGGRLSSKLIKIVLSLGVAIAVFIAMLRVIKPELELTYFLIPGFATAVVLSFFADPLIVGIAYDAGGVASGPLTATFVLAFANGAAMGSPGADIMSEGFGVIAAVAMMPVLSIMILGVIVKMKSDRELPDTYPERTVSVLEEGIGVACVSLFVRVPRNHAARVVDVARNAGAGPATILHGRHGSVKTEDDFLEIKRFFEKEVELILFVVDKDIALKISEALDKDERMDIDIGKDVFIMPCLSN